MYKIVKMKKEIKKELFFENTWKDHSWLHAAQKYLRDNWYSYWSLQRDADIWVMKWYDLEISKWRNLSQKDIAELDWVIDCNCQKWYRHWKVRVTLYEKNSSSNIDIAIKEDIRLNADSINISNQIADEKSNSFNRHIFIELEMKWELWEFLWEWNERIVYQHKKNSNLVIKIPKCHVWITQNKMEANHYLIEETTRIKMWLKHFPNWLAKCAYNVEDQVLYMQKLKTTEWSDFGVNPEWIIRKFDLNIIN